MTKFKQGDRVVPEQMTTTERIVEAVMDYADYESQSDISIRIESLRTAIASVIGKELNASERTEFEKLRQQNTRLREITKQMVIAVYEMKQHFEDEFLPAPPKDLTPKTDTTDGKY